MEVVPYHNVNNRRYLCTEKQAIIVLATKQAFFYFSTSLEIHKSANVDFVALVTFVISILDIHANLVNFTFV